MTDNTAVFWDVNGQSLHTYAFSIETKGGDHHNPAGKKGDDVPLPFHDGHERTEKTREPLFFTLPMWVAGVNQDGSVDGTMSQEAKATANWNYLISLFNQDDQFPLTKRWYEGATVKSATAMAEVIEPFSRTKVAKNVYRFGVPIKIADGFYYGAPVTIASPGTHTIQGLARTGHLTITMAAGTITFPDGNWIQYTGSGSAVIDCEEGIAKVGASVVNGLILRNRRFPQWPQLVPGSRTLTGTGSITYEPAYW